MVTDLIDSTAANAEAAQAHSLDDVRQHPQRLAGSSAKMEAERRQTKAFLYERLYNSKALHPEKDLAERIVTELFETWMAHPEKLPESYQQKLKAEPLPRVICDYIAGMTDNYALEQHEKLVTR